MKEMISLLIAGKNLSHLQAQHLMQLFFECPLEQQAAILALLSAKKESYAELAGILEALQTTLPSLNSRFDVIDIVGTGGDGIGTFNISTAASLVVASSGAYVAKHGGRSVSSLSGSSDVFAALGIENPKNQQQLTHALTDNHFAFISAPLFNPVLKALGPIRKSLGFPTVFNILGPLLNPLRPRRQVIGVYRADLVIKVAKILQMQGSQHAFVVHSDDGLDEFSISAATKVAELKNGCIKEYIITPEEVGLSRAPLSAILGGSSDNNARIITEILSNQCTGPMLDIVLFNAAAGLCVANLADSLHSGVQIARDLISSGKTSRLLSALQARRYYD